MSDIVDQLRTIYSEDVGYSALTEAATEITDLRHIVRELASWVMELDPDPSTDDLGLSLDVMTYIRCGRDSDEQYRAVIDRAMRHTETPEDET